MTRFIPLLALFILIAPGTATAQNDPCTLDFNFKVGKSQLVLNEVNWQRIGQRMETCETLRVLSDTAYTALIVEMAFRDRQIAVYDSLVAELRTGQAARDSLLSLQTRFIDRQQQWLVRYDTLLTDSNQLVEDATKNTDRALRQISLFKWGTLGIVVGVLAGALIN